MRVCLPIHDHESSPAAGPPYLGAGPEAIDQLQRAAHATVNGLLEEVFAASGVDRRHVYEAVVVGLETHALSGTSARSSRSSSSPISGRKGASSGSSSSEATPIRSRK